MEQPKLAADVRRAPATEKVDADGETGMSDWKKQRKTSKQT